MDVKVLELEPAKARLVIAGEGHTFMNALVEEMLLDPGVDVAKYVIKFQFADPELLVTTREGRAPVAAIRDACRRLVSSCDELIADLETWQ
ncbi:MAG TPA: DNA-directed RNA polymerase subunit L [Methanoregulaceae archaeon]|nr:DNA-directed RNA polymerase subunit L [Methanoregulaceae archaeon]